MINDRLTMVKEKIASAALRGGYDYEDITLVAVTKTVSADIVSRAFAAGVADFGENRLQDALPKVASLSNEIRWHFIGYLQTNKVKDVINNFYMIHSVDRMNLAEALEKKAQNLGKKVPVLIQVNTSGEKSKAGISPQEVEDFLVALKDFRQIQVKGLMTMAPFTDNPEETRPFFRKLREIKEKIHVPGIDLKYLSMGMSNDYEIAVEEGANIVRLGSTIFGERQY